MFFEQHNPPIPPLSGPQPSPLQEIESALKHTPFSVEVLLDALSLHPRLEYLLQSPNGKLFSMSLYEHTRCVMNQYERYFAEMDLPGNLSHDVLRLTLALHDIGKPLSYLTGRSQHECHLEVIDSVRDIIPLSDEELVVVKSLIKGDPIGLYVQDKTDIQSALSTLEEMWQEQHLSREDFYTILTRYYQSDVSGYSSNAGSIGSVDHLFFEDSTSGRFQYHYREPRLLMTVDNDRRLELLRQLFVQQ